MSFYPYAMSYASYPSQSGSIHDANNSSGPDTRRFEKEIDKAIDAAEDADGGCGCCCFRIKPFKDLTRCA